MWESESSGNQQMALVASLRPKFAKVRKSVTLSNIHSPQQTKRPLSQDQSFRSPDHDRKGLLAHSSPTFRFPTPGKPNLCCRIATESPKYPSAG